MIVKLAQNAEIRSVINLREKEEKGYCERAPLAQRLGLSYLSDPVIPATITTLSDADWERVLQFLDQAPRPQLVHWY